VGKVFLSLLVEAILLSYRRISTSFVVRIISLRNFCRFVKFSFDFNLDDNHGRMRTSNLEGGKLSVNFLPEFPIVLSENLPK